MGRTGRVYVLRFLVAFLAAPIAAISVNPSLCPTNKIAPHRRIANWEYGTGRTFGAYYDLLVPESLQYAPNDQNNLQEQPQEDDPTDCGEIEDYDENDLSSISPQGNRRQGERDGRGFFGTFFRAPHHYHHHQRPPPNFPPPPNYPQRPPSYPQKPNRPSTDRPQQPSYPATRPPYWSGGFFGTNDYRPPLQQYPSDHLKPIHEYSEDSQATYRPNVVGGSLGHVVGVSPIIPTSPDDSTTSRTFYNRLRTSTSSPNSYPTRRPRARNINGNGIFGSFVDLLFK